MLVRPWQSSLQETASCVYFHCILHRTLLLNHEQASPLLDFSIGEAQMDCSCICCSCTRLRAPSGAMERGKPTWWMTLQPCQPARHVHHSLEPLAAGWWWWWCCLWWRPLNPQAFAPLQVCCRAAPLPPPIAAPAAISMANAQIDPYRCLPPPPIFSLLAKISVAQAAGRSPRAALQLVVVGHHPAAARLQRPLLGATDHEQAAAQPPACTCQTA